MKSTRVNIQFPPELLKRIDEKAAEQYLSRSAFIVSTMSQYLNGLNAIQAMSELSTVMNKAIEISERPKE